MPDMIADNLPITTQTPAATVARLTAECCFNHFGKLMIYPPWLTNGDVDQAVKAGLLKQVTFGRATFAHTDLFKALP